MADQYSLTIQNKSSNTFNFCIFQTGQNADVSGAVVWLCRRCHPDTSVRFTWDTDYCFFWAEQGEMKQRENAAFSTWGTKPADPADADKCITGFTYSDGAYEFVQTKQKGTPGALQIVADGTIAAGKAMIGIGMSENCIACVPAAPNILRSFTPQTEYRVAFGNMKQGDPISDAVMQQSIRLDFPPNVFDLSVALKNDNTWTKPE